MQSEEATEESSVETGYEEKSAVAERLGQDYKLVCGVAGAVSPSMELINLSLKLATETSWS